MGLISGRKKYVLFSLAIIVFSACFNIVDSKAKTRSLKPGEIFTLTFGENLSTGDYYLARYSNFIKNLQ